MNTDFKQYIHLAFKDELNLDSTEKAFEEIMNGNVDDIQISSFLSLLQKSGVKAHHVMGAIKVMKSKMVKVNSQPRLMDTCGTGGDGKNSLNVSTAVAFVLAANGIPIAKHGNRSITSKCGSADVLQSLNINIELELSKIESCLNEVGICFMFAPNHHSAMRFVGKVRQNLGIRTIFNILGPLLNPANVKEQLVGVYSEEVFNLYKDVFMKDESKKVCLIAGFDGNDEISLNGNNLIFTKKNGTFTFSPKTIGIEEARVDEISGSDASFNANRILEIFNGKKDSFYRTVCINAAFGILLDEESEVNDDSIKKAYDKSQSIINEGLPLKIIENLSKFTNI